MKTIRLFIITIFFVNPLLAQKYVNLYKTGNTKINLEKGKNKLESLFTENVDAKLFTQLIEKDNISIKNEIPFFVQPTEIQLYTSRNLNSGVGKDRLYFQKPQNDNYPGKSLDPMGYSYEVLSLNYDLIKSKSGNVKLSIEVSVGVEISTHPAVKNRL